MSLFTQMVWIDYAIIGLIGIYWMIGLARGGHNEIQSLFSWLLSLGIAWSFALEFSEFLHKAIEHTSARLAAAFASLLIISRIVTSFILFLMADGARKNKISLIDHFLGMLVGIVRGAIIVAAIILLGGLTPLPKDSWWHESKLIPPFQFSAVWLRDHFPSGMAGYIRFS